MRQLINLTTLAFMIIGCSNESFRSLEKGFCDLVYNKVICDDGYEYELPEGTPGVDGTDGLNGSDGVDGLPGLIHTSFAIPTHGACYQVAPGLYVENEGDHVDVYNNSDCAHSPAPKKALCNNVYEQEVCPVGNYLFYVEDAYGDMIIHTLEFN